jgi:hypothetical protein
MKMIKNLRGKERADREYTAIREIELRLLKQ